MNKKTRDRLFMAISFVLCVLLFAVKWTGGVWHAVFGILLTVLMVGHMCKQYVKMKYRKTSVQAVDQVMMAALIVMFGTGMLIHPLQDVFLILMLHKLSAIVFVLATIGHVLQHRAESSRLVRAGKEVEKQEMPGGRSDAEPAM